MTKGLFKFHLLDTEYKIRLLKIAIPLMLSQLISQVQMLIDRIFLGRLDVIYMSAVGNASTPLWTTFSIVFCLSMGVSILISQAVGEKNLEKAKHLSASLLVYNNILPFILFCFWFFCSPLVFKMLKVSDTLMPYCVSYTKCYSPIFLLCGLGAASTVILQTSGDTKPLVYFGAIRSLSNMILDYIMIFGKFGCPAMGIKGAALATAISEYVGGAYLAYKFFKSKNLITRPTMIDIKRIKLFTYFKGIKLGVPTALESFFWNIGNLVILRILNSIDDFAAGIFSIVFTIEVLAVVIIDALGSSTMTLTGEATGAKDSEMFKSVVKTAYIWSALVSVFTLVLVTAFPRQVMSWFTKDISIINNSALYLFFIGINLFSKSLNIIIGNGIRGYGNTRWMFYTQILGTIMVISIAYLFVNGLNLGMVGVFLAILCDEAIRGIINTIKFCRIKF